MTTSYNRISIDEVGIFYREAGRRGQPVILLLHGFPSASHMFRDLIPLLADDFHLIAPDLPGFGQSDMPAREAFSYTFDRLADVIEQFTERLSIERYSMYIFDYGAPIGLRIAKRHPDRVAAFITQNGNAYAEGLSEAFAPLQDYWTDPEKPEKRSALRALLAPETTRFQYLHGVTDERRVSPDGYTLDDAYLARQGAHEIHLDLFLDYRTNVALYGSFQEYLRTHRPPVLAVWGANDPFFLPAGAEAYRRDVPDAEVHMLDTGHFALETHAEEIASRIRDFLGRKLGRA